MRRVVCACAVNVLIAVALIVGLRTIGSHAQRGDAERRRVVYLSVDAAADWIVDRLIEQGKAPAFAAMKREGASADAMIGAMPSLTAVSHATLWTGAWSRFHGIVGNSVSIPPRSDHGLLEWRSGFDSTALTAEPIWTSAARAGKRVLVLQATQSYPFSDAVNGRIVQFDVYGNRHVGADITETRLQASAPYQFTVGNATCTLMRGAEGSVRVRVESQEAVLWPGPAGRFSPPMWTTIDGRPIGLRFRLLRYDDRTGAVMLAYGAGAEIVSNTPSELPAFRLAAGSIVGEEAGGAAFYPRGRFGPTFAAGGDGEAERILTDFLEANHEYFTGSLQYASTRDWDLLIGYLPNFDAASHALVGMVDPDSPRYSPAVAARVWPVLERVFKTTVDDYIADVRRRFPDAAIVVTADHGMEGIGGYIRPNVALRKAGLLTVDRNGGIDLSRTQALFVQAKANMIFVNTTAWKGGVVAPERRGEVKRLATAALLAARDPRTAAPLIREVFDAEIDGPGLGIGGDMAGDLYFDPAPGYYTQDAPTGDLDVIESTPSGAGAHGAAPWRRKLNAIFYVAGPGVAAGRDLGVIRSIDAAPTVSDLLGVPPPANAIGRALPVR